MKNKCEALVLRKKLHSLKGALRRQRGETITTDGIHLNHILGVSGPQVHDQDGIIHDLKEIGKSLDHSIPSKHVESQSRRGHVIPKMGNEVVIRFQGGRVAKGLLMALIPPRRSPVSLKSGVTIRSSRGAPLLS